MIEAKQLLINFDGPGSSGKTTLADRVGRNLTRLGFDVTIREEPPVLLDVDGQPVLWKGKNSRQLFKLGAIADGGAAKEKEFAQMMWALGMRSWLYNTELATAAQVGGITLVSRGNFSTIVYQGVREGGLLEDQVSLFYRSLDILGIPGFKLAFILLPELGSMVNRLAARLVVGEGNPDVYDDLAVQGQYLSAYLKICQNPERFRRLSRVIHALPTAKVDIEGQVAVVEALVTLRCVVAGVMGGVSCPDDIRSWVNLKPGGTDAAGEAEVRLAAVLSKLEGGRQAGAYLNLEGGPQLLNILTYDRPKAERSHELFYLLRSHGKVEWGGLGCHLSRDLRTCIFSWSEKLSVPGLASS